MGKQPANEYTRAINQPAHRGRPPECRPQDCAHGCPRETLPGKRQRIDRRKQDHDGRDRGPIELRELQAARHGERQKGGDCCPYRPDKSGSSVCPQLACFRHKSAILAKPDSSFPHLGPRADINGKKKPRSSERGFLLTGLIEPESGLSTCHPCRRGRPEVRPEPSFPPAVP